MLKDVNATILSKWSDWFLLPTRRSHVQEIEHIKGRIRGERQSAILFAELGDKKNHDIANKKALHQLDLLIAKGGL